MRQVACCRSRSCAWCRRPGRVAAGRVLFEGSDLLTLPPAAMRDIRGNRIAMIFQEPMTSLNPVFTVGRSDHRGDARA